VSRVVLVQWGTGIRGVWTNEDGLMLPVVVEARAGRVAWFGHGEYQLENRSAQKSSRSAG
jgi:UDP-glucuronate 4-epimerase